MIINAAQSPTDKCVNYMLINAACYIHYTLLTISPDACDSSALQHVNYMTISLTVSAIC